MDVHAPHDPVHTWRDFAIHLAIVTIGLFIALMLDEAVQHWHHRRIVAEARANLRHELQRNQDAAQKDIGYIDKNMEVLQADVQTLRLLRTHPKNFSGSLTNTMNFDSLGDAAWRTARDTGALTYMPYDEVQRYSDVYMLEQLVNDHAIKAGESSFEAASPLQMGDDPAHLPDAEYTRMLEQDGSVLVQLNVLKQFLRDYRNEGADALKH